MTEVVRGAESFRAAYDAAYDAWRSYIDRRPRSRKKLVASAIKAATDMDPEQLPDAEYLRQSASDLRTVVLDSKFGTEDWWLKVVETLACISPVLVAYEVPWQKCTRCKRRADDGGGPCCGCGK